MDPIANPYSPGAGSPPPELVGRDPILEQARVLLQRVLAGKAEKSLLLTGLRGVGKTVLLNDVKRLATKAGYLTVSIEAPEGQPLGTLLAPHLRSSLYHLDRIAGAGDKVKRGLRVLRSFLGMLKLSYGEVSIGLDIDPEVGEADSGNLELDLTSLLLAVGEAAAEKSTGLAILIDEIQYFAWTELGALIVAMHKIQQMQLPVVLIGAGLPILPGMAGEAKSYAERLFSFPDVGALSEEDSARALRTPAAAVGVTFEDDAIHEIFSLTRGYPYFLQEWGYQSWNKAPTTTISRDVVRLATPVAIQRLDADFFRVRFNRLTPSEKRFLRAMATLGPEACRTASVAEELGLKIPSIGPVRATLIQKGMVYSPSHGYLAYTVPLFDEYMRRAMPVEN